MLTRILSFLPVVLGACSPAFCATGWVGMRPEGTELRIYNDNDASLKITLSRQVAPLQRYRRHAKDLGAPGQAKAAAQQEWIVGPRRHFTFVMHQTMPLCQYDIATLDGSTKVKCMLDNYHGIPKLINAQGVASLTWDGEDDAFSWLVPVQPDPPSEVQAPAEVPAELEAEPEQPSLDALRAASTEHRKSLLELQNQRPLLPNEQRVVEYPELNRANRTGKVAERIVFPRRRMDARAALAQNRALLGAPGPETIGMSRDLKARKADLSAFGQTEAAKALRAYRSEARRRQKSPYSVDLDTIPEKPERGVGYRPRSASSPFASTPELRGHSRSLSAESLGEQASPNPNPSEQSNQAAVDFYAQMLDM